MILIGTDEGIYRWLEGSGWPVHHGLQDRSIVGMVSPAPGVIAVLDRAGDVLETTDHGLNWRLIPRPEGAGRPTALSVSAGSSLSLVIAVRPLSLYRRSVGAAVPRAAREELVGAGLRPKLYNTGLVVARRATTLIARGRRPVHDPEAVRLAGWQPVNAPAAPRSTLGPEVRALATADGVWYAAVTGAGLWTSRDAGGSWTQTHGLPSEVFDIRPVPTRAGHVWAASADGLWFSADSGATWEDRGQGLGADRQVRALEIKPGAPDTLLVGAAPRASEATAPSAGLNYALFETTSSGKTWTQVKKNFPDRLEYDAISAIKFDPTDPTNVLVALGSGELWATRNDGAYWSPLARQTKAARVLCGSA
jgi:photosystem II stability/assembly factor-like uncharacterized protein